MFKVCWPAAVAAETREEDGEDEEEDEEANHSWWQEPQLDGVWSGCHDPWEERKRRWVRTTWRLYDLQETHFAF